MTDKITCDCGSIIQQRNYNKHIQSVKHLRGSGLFEKIKPDFNQISKEWEGRGLKLHAVHINKRVPYETAKQYANELINNKKKSHL